ncbi:hypothetical protein [Oceanibaculum nanhaiense]|uniref:hypothetical protein n=1 Tax=Oceanibaculum nanhaiense TaxID=1909734 RepID=UPI00111DC08D|nr:hypothetical protein [Oceanibaculum nanhaiense]
MLQAIRSRLPGYSQELDPRRNFLGEPVNVPAGFGPDWLSPFAYSEFRNEAVKTELARLAIVHEGGFRQPRPERYGVDLREIAMPAFSGLPGTSHRQSAFDRWLELTGTLRVGGRTLKETLEAVIQSAAYYRLSDGDADFSGGRLIAVQRIVEQYRKAAEVQLWRENPAVHQAYREWKLNQARARTIGVQ